MAAAFAQSGRQKGEAARLSPHTRPRTVVYRWWAQRKDGRQEQHARAHGATAAANDNGGREKAREHARPPSRDATRPLTMRAAATKHARTTSPLPRCNGGRWRRWRPQTRTRMLTALLSAPDGSRRRDYCHRRCNSAHEWSTNRVCRQRDRSRRSRSVTTLPLRRRSQRGLKASSETVLDGLAGGTTPPYATKTGGGPRSPNRSGGIRAAAFVACHPQGPSGHA